MLPIRASALKAAAELFPADHRLVLEQQSVAGSYSFLVVDIDTDDPDKKQAVLSNDCPELCSICHESRHSSEWKHGTNEDVAEVA